MLILGFYFYSGGGGIFHEPKFKGRQVQKEISFTSENKPNPIGGPSIIQGGGAKATPRPLK